MQEMHQRLSPSACICSIKFCKKVFYFLENYCGIGKYIIIQEEVTPMSLTSIIIIIIVGLIAGWLAGVIWRGRGFGLAYNLIIGIIGSFIGGFLFRLVGISTYNIIGSIIAAIVGALLLLFILSKIKK
jgi:uncharacterized membrane protein YeaQ/YmgE (transglycosylase-associated protein family)